MTTFLTATIASVLLSDMVVEVELTQTVLAFNACDVNLVPSTQSTPDHPRHIQQNATLVVADVAVTRTDQPTLFAAHPASLHHGQFMTINYFWLSEI